MSGATRRPAARPSRRGRRDTSARSRSACTCCRPAGDGRRAAGPASAGTADELLATEARADGRGDRCAVPRRVSSPASAGHAAVGSSTGGGSLGRVRSAPARSTLDGWVFANVAGRRAAAGRAARQRPAWSWRHDASGWRPARGTSTRSQPTVADRRDPLERSPLRADPPPSCARRRRRESGCGYAGTRLAARSAARWRCADAPGHVAGRAQPRLPIRRLPPTRTCEARVAALLPTLLVSPHSDYLTTTGWSRSLRPHSGECACRHARGVGPGRLRPSTRPTPGTCTAGSAAACESVQRDDASAGARAPPPCESDVRAACSAAARGSRPAGSPMLLEHRGLDRPCSDGARHRLGSLSGGRARRR